MFATQNAFSATSPVLSAALLTRQYQLNFDYLELLVGGHAFVSHGKRYLPLRMLDGLRACTVEQRQAVAAAAFSLYSLGFEDTQFWLSALRVAPQSIEARYARWGAPVMETTFCEVALIHAWHVAVTQPVAARMLYGMSSAIVNCMSLVQLWQLKRIAADYPGLTMPRWLTNPCFWPDLIEFARAADWPRLDTVHRLGQQLMAGELQAGDEPRSATHLRHRNLLMHRLQGPLRKVRR